MAKGRGSFSFVVCGLGMKSRASHMLGISPPSHTSRPRVLFFFFLSLFILFSVNVLPEYVYIY